MVLAFQIFCVHMRGPARPLPHVVAQSLSRVRLFCDPVTVACQAPPSMGLPCQK